MKVSVPMMLLLALVAVALFALSTYFLWGPGAARGPSTLYDDERMAVRLNHDIDTALVYDDIAGASYS